MDRYFDCHQEKGETIESEIFALQRVINIPVCLVVLTDDETVMGCS